MPRRDTDSPSSGNANKGLPPAAKEAAKNLSIKQEREQRRLAKVEAFKREQAKAKRNRLTAIILSSVAAVAVLAVIVTVVVMSSNQRNPADITVAGVQTWDNVEIGHTDAAVDYEADYGMNPPAGGIHNAAWLNCGVYTEPQQAENAVHALEHGAVWVTYNADDLSQADIDTLRGRLPSTYVVLSPYVGLDAPAVASAWGAQLKLDGVDDPRLTDFIDKYWKSQDLAEYGAPCTGGIDGPGKIA